MTGSTLRYLIDKKCISCINYMGCKLQDNYCSLSREIKLDNKVYDKLEKCLFYRKTK